MPHFSDRDLIQRAKEGDKEAYKELFNKYNGKILSYLARYIGDYQKAEDVTIETFLDVYKRLPDYEEKGKFLPWVYMIATNFAKKEFRKRKIKEVSLDKPISGESGATFGDLSGDDKFRPDHKVIKDELEMIIEQIISKFDKKYRSVLLLCDIQELSYEETAYIMKCSKLTVGTRLNRARKMLHEALKKRGYNV